jgi:hypothetical protein
MNTPSVIAWLFKLEWHICEHMNSEQNGKDRSQIEQHAARDGFPRFCLSN